MLITSKNVLTGVCSFAATDNTRPALASVRITPTHFEATDSYRLVRVRHTSDDNAQDFEPFLLDATALAGVAKLSGKKEHILIARREDGLVVCETNKSSTAPIQRTILEPVDATYPDFDTLVLAPRKPIADEGPHFALSAPLAADTLKGLAQILGTHTPLRFTIASPKDPIRIDFTTDEGHEGISLLMPVSMG